MLHLEMRKVFCFAVTQIPANEIAITAKLSHHYVYMATAILNQWTSYIVNLYIILGTVCVVHFVTWKKLLLYLTG